MYKRQELQMKPGVLKDKRNIKGDRKRSIILRVEETRWQENGERLSHEYINVYKQHVLQINTVNNVRIEEITFHALVIGYL